MTDIPIETRRQQLLSLYQAALERVNGERAVAQYLEQHPLPGRWAVVAIGKAAAAMAMGAQHALGEGLYSGLVITKYSHGDARLAKPGWQVMESAHPVPDAHSLAAGDALLAYLADLPEEIPVLFLFSGGASALAEVLPDGVTLDELVQVNDWLLRSGLSIEQMNSVRKRISCIKGGRLARYLGKRRCLQLLISDVPGDDPATIASGPLVPSNTDEPIEDLPGWLQQLIRQAEKQSEALSQASIETHVIAGNDLACEAIVEQANTLGVMVYTSHSHFQGDVEALAEHFAETLLEGEPGIYVWGGESTVRLPEAPGRGGRNQHLALLLAQRLAAHNNILLLAAGTDGSDGPTDDAGALIDGGTLKRGEAEGLSTEAALAGADSGHFLEASGDLIQTGPTGTNVMDLVIGWKRNAD
jgi:hydroxypyruvate reductase